MTILPSEERIWFRCITTILESASYEFFTISNSAKLSLPISSSPNKFMMYELALIEYFFFVVIANYDLGL